MVRRVLSDAIWEQLETTLRVKGCHCWTNDREVMEAILWKLRTGAPWRDVPVEFCPWKTAYNQFDAHLYKQRHLVENLFARLKHFRSIATRFEKLARNFKAILFLACTFIWLKLN